MQDWNEYVVVVMIACFEDSVLQQPPWFQCDRQECVKGLPNETANS